MNIQSTQPQETELQGAETCFYLCTRRRGGGQEAICAQLLHMLNPKIRRFLTLGTTKGHLCGLSLRFCKHLPA